MVNSNKLIIHCGFPKTSSSTLQFGLLKDLDSDGLINLLTWRQYDEFENHELRFSSSLFQNKKPIERYFNFNKSKITILSDESLTAPLRLRKNNFGNNAVDPISFPRIIKNLYKDIITDFNVIMIIRNQVDLLYSQYVEEYKLVLENKDNLLYREGRLNLKDLEIYKFSNTIKEWQNIFGKNKVKVLLFEDLKYDSDKFYESVSDFFNCSLNIVRNCYNQNKINSKKKTDKGYVTVGGEILVPFLNDNEKKQIFNYFKKSNNNLEKLINVNRSTLKKYGYI